MTHETRARELSPWSARRALTEQMSGPQRNAPPLPPKEDQNAAPWKRDTPGRLPRNPSPVRNAGNVSANKSPPPKHRTEGGRETEEKERVRPGSRKSEQSGAKSPSGSRDRELSPEPYRKPQDSRTDERRRHRSKDRHGDRSTHRRRDSSRERRHDRSRERRRHRSSERKSEKLEGSRRDRSTSKTDHHGRSRGGKRDRSPIKSERRDRSRDHSRDRSRDRRRNRSRERKKDSEGARTHDRKRDRSRDDHKHKRRDRSRSRSRDRRRHRSPDRSPDHHRRRNRSPSSSRSPSPPPKRHKPTRSPSPRRRAKAPLPSQELSFRGTDNSSLPPTKYGSAPPTLEKPNFKPTGLLAKAANKVEGTKISLKYHEPPEARKPPSSAAWRLFVFKGDAVVDTIELHSRSCWLLGRAHQVVDYVLEHPSSSSQHAVIQFRYILKTTEDEYGVKKQRGKVKPYVIDLESSNGTELNGKTLEPAKYCELRDKDILTFAGSEREYVVVLPPPEEVKEGV